MDARLQTNLFVTATGRLTVVGREPDGDSVHFIPDNPKTLLALPHASRLRPSKDTSVQLRIDGIDAPETHFIGYAQPEGIPAREVFLKAAGFSNVQFSDKGVVTASVPEQVAATIFIGLLDPYGRPVSYLVAGTSSAHKDSEVVQLSDELLAKTVNVHMLLTGAAYVTAYSSTPVAHRQFLFTAAKVAHDKKLGVWAADKTSRFTLESHDSLGPNGTELILPKLFRRATAYLDAKQKATVGTFPEWLQTTVNDPVHSQDDYVIRADGSVVRLHTLIQQTGTTITTELDLLSDVFIEQ